MLKLNALKFDKVWGYELWLASTHKNGMQKEFLDYADGEYPLLVKIIQANDTLSVQVHPDDKTAVDLEGSGNVGKTECWYVLDAAPDAKLVYGLSGSYSAEELSDAIKSNTLEKFLNNVPVKKGDFIFIPSGTVHAIGGGLRLLEVQQSCDLTYRLYDWGRPREVHIEKGLRSIKNDSLKKIAAFPVEFSCEYFSLEEIKITGAYSAFNSNEKSASGVVLYFVLEGSGKVKGGASNSDGASMPKGIESTNTDRGASVQQPQGVDVPRAIEFNAEDIFALSAKEKITFMSERAKILKISCAQK